MREHALWEKVLAIALMALAAIMVVGVFTILGGLALGVIEHPQPPLQRCICVDGSDS